MLFFSVKFGNNGNAVLPKKTLRINSTPLNNGTGFRISK